MTTPGPACAAATAPTTQHALAPVARPGIPRSLPSRRQRRRRSRWSARSEARTNDLEVRQAAATIGNEEGHQSSQESGGRLGG
jgi:hypothetical protein